ncbi:hypothetical protein [Fluviicola sp.]|uniref:hypothetical protein n=1 Tax=Fluviicola sp. TaxID=1917219 RepID=UPI0031E3AAFB
MIRLSHSINSINFTFDQDGLDAFIRLFGRLFAEKNAEIDRIPFLQKDGTESLIKLSFAIAGENTLRLSKNQLHITMEQEDSDDTLERFRQLRSNPEMLYPEWIQVKKLSNHRTVYLYMFFRTDLNNKKPV